MSKPPSKPSSSRLKQSLGQGGRGRRRAAASRAVEQEKTTPRQLPEHPRIPSAPAEVLTNKAEVEAFCAEARSAGEVAYDTEFIGEESYIPKICLVQLATPQRVVLIDPIQGAPLDDVWSLLSDPKVRVLVHSGLQDLVPIWRETGVPATNVLDTQVAAGFADRSFPIALSALVDEFVGITLDKSYTFTRWDQRPLRAGHLEYAADDVRFLFVIADALAARTAERGHDAKVKEECLTLVDPQTYTPDPVHRMQRALGNRKFNRRQRTALMELLTLRDHIAQTEDLPPRSVLKDDVCARAQKTCPKPKMLCWPSSIFRDRWSRLGAMPFWIFWVRCGRWNQTTWLEGRLVKNPIKTVPASMRFMHSVPFCVGGKGLTPELAPRAQRSLAFTLTPSTASVQLVSLIPVGEQNSLAGHFLPCFRARPV